MRPKTYLARHGSCSFEGFELSCSGRRESSYVGSELRHKGLGSKTLILSSAHKPAKESADIIGEVLGSEQIYHSNIVKEASIRPCVIRDLNFIIEAGLAENGIVRGSRDLVVVSHTELSAVVLYGRTGVNVRGDELATIVENWDNPVFDKDSPFTQVFEQQFKPVEYRIAV